MDINVEKIKGFLNKAREDLTKRNKYWRPKEGINIVRLCPPYPGSDMPVAQGYVHWKANKSGRGKIVCRKTAGMNEKCPICDEVSRLYNLGDEASRRLAASKRRRQEFAFNLIDRGEENPLPYVFTITPGVTLDAFGSKVLQLISDYDVREMFDAENGRDFIIEKIIEKDKKATYFVRPYEVFVYECPTCGSKVETDNKKELPLCRSCDKRMAEVGIKRPKTPLGIPKIEEYLWDLSKEYIVPSVEEMIEFMNSTSDYGAGFSQGGHIDGDSGDLERAVAAKLSNLTKEPSDLSQRQDDELYF